MWKRILSILRAVSWTYARLLIQSGLTRLPMVEASGNCKRHLVHGRPSSRLLHSWRWPHSLPTWDWRPMSVDYAFCLLDIVDWPHKPKSTVLIVPSIQARKPILSLHGELSLSRHQLVLAVVPLTLWAHILSWGLPRRNKSVLIYDLVEIRIVGRVYSRTRIEPLVLVHDFYAGFGSDVWRWVLGDLAPQSALLLHFILSSDIQISVLFTIGSVRVVSIPLLLTGKFNRIQIGVLADAVHLGHFLVTVFSWAKSRLVLSLESLRIKLHILVRLILGQLRMVIIVFHLLSVWYRQLWHLIWPNHRSVWL